MPKLDFDAFVKREAEKPPVDWGKERDEWLARLDALYNQIQGYLRSYLESGQARIEFRDIPLNEQDIGQYVAREMVLTIGSQQITFTPIGTILIATKGRVDVRGPAGTARLTLVNKKINDARSLIRPTHEREPIEWIWKIASRPPEVKLTELTSDAFFDLILEVVNA